MFAISLGIRGFRADFSVKMPVIMFSHGVFTITRCKHMGCDSFKNDVVALEEIN